MTVSIVFQDLKFKIGFPPRQRIQEIRSQFASRNMSGSSMEAEAIAGAYRESAEAVMGQFTDIVIRNAEKLDLKSSVEITDIITKKLETIFTESMGQITQELERWRSDDLRRRATGVLYDKFDELGEYLRGKVQLRELEMDKTNSSLQITESQIGNLVIGSISQSQLTASAQKIIQKGGSEAEIGRVVEKFLEKIGQVDEKYKAEKAELYDLLKGLIQQIDLKQEERSPSTIRAILSRIKEVGSTAVEFGQLYKEYMPPLLALLGLR